MIGDISIYKSRAILSHCHSFNDRQVVTWLGLVHIKDVTRKFV